MRSDEQRARGRQAFILIGGILNLGINFIAFKRWRAYAAVSMFLIFSAGLMASSATGSIESEAGAGGGAGRNSWRGITPLQSSAADVARVIGLDSDLTEAPVSGPFKVEGGEVTFSFLTPSVAKIYRAPRSMFGKVFTIYFKPDDSMTRADLKLAASFKQ